MDILSTGQIFKSIEHMQSVDTVLDAISQGLSEQTGHALVRIWLKDSGDKCNHCIFKHDCSQVECLHLVSSNGVSLDGFEWKALNGYFGRIPLSYRKIGHIGLGHEVLIPEISTDCEWIKDTEWARQESIKSFAGQPLYFKGEVIGVLAVFSRNCLTAEDMGILKAFAQPSHKTV